MDSTNIIKLFIVSITGFGVLVVFILNFKTFRYHKNNVIIWLSLSFAFLSVLITLFTKSNIQQQIYGVSGRNTGLIFHLAMVGFLIGGNLFASKKLLQQSVKIFIFAGIITLSYGIIQIFDFDPLIWSSSTEWVASTFGNPNFFSTFLGMFVSLVIPYLFVNSNLLARLVCIVGVIITILIILKTQSQQGLILVLIGLATSTFFYFKSRNSGKKLLFLYLVIVFTAGMVLVFDILQKVPWNPILYKPSVSARGDYWRAGVNLIEKYPITGVGFDGLREQYGLVRDPLSLTRGDQLDLDAAHNIFIDKAIAGGIPFLVLYLSIIICVLISIKKLVSETTNFEPALIGVIACWFAWIAQSFISIDNVGVTSWGWYFSGLITGLAALSNKSSQDYAEPMTKIKFNTKAYLAGALIGASIVAPLITREYRYVKSIESGDAKALEAAALQFPQDIFRIGRAAELLKEYKIQNESIFLARAAVKNFPESYSAWAVLYTSPWASDQERVQAIEKLFQLDPYRAKYQGIRQ